MKVGYAYNSAEAYQQYRQKNLRLQYANTREDHSTSQQIYNNMPKNRKTTSNPLGIIHNQPAPQHAASPRPAVKPQRRTQPRSSANVKAGPASFFRKLFILIVIAAIFAMLGFLVMRYAELAKNSQDIFTLTRMLDEKKIETERLKVEYAQTQDMSVIEKRAAELGMGFAAEDQVVYMYIPSEAGEIEVADAPKEQPAPEKSFWDILRGLLRG